MRLIVQQASGGRQEHAAQAVQTLRLERGLLTIGRGADNDLVLQDTQVSRHHAELRRRGDQWFLVDLGSTNGTFVGGTRLRPDQAWPVLPGVPIQIGDTLLVLEEEPPPSLTPLREPSAQESSERAAEIQDYHPERSEGPKSKMPNPLPWLVVAFGSVILIVGSLLDWIRVEVNLPFLGRVMDQSYTGLDSEQAWLFIAVALLALGLLLVDVIARKRGSGLAAGVGQALVGAVAVVVVAVSLYRYYRIGTQQILGVSLVDILTEYLGDQVHISIQLGVYLVAIGLVALIVGGLLRLFMVAREPA